MSPAREPGPAHELCARLAPLGELSARRMFGGVGLYCDGVFFGLVDADVVYFRVDDESVAAYRAAGSAPFQPFPDKPPMGTYWEVPLGVLERDAELVTWGRRALAAARARDAARRRKPKSRTRGGRATTEASAASTPIEELANLGPKSAGWLRSVGITTCAELERVGPVEAFRRVVAAGHAPTLVLLYALEGARLGLRADRLSEAVKSNLRARAGRAAEPRVPPPFRPRPKS